MESEQISSYTEIINFSVFFKFFFGAEGADFFCFFVEFGAEGARNLCFQGFWPTKTAGILLDFGAEGAFFLIFGRRRRPIFFNFSKP